MVSQASVPNFEAIAKLSAVLSAVLFLLGWSYLYGYYHTFGVSVLELDIPVLVAPAYAINLLGSPRTYALGIVVALLMTLFRYLASLWSWRRRVVSKVAIWTSWLLWPVGILLLSSLASELGHGHAIEGVGEMGHLPLVLSISLHDTDPPPLEVAGARTRLLMISNKRFYFANAHQDSEIHMWVIPEDRVRSLQVLVDVDP